MNSYIIVHSQRFFNSGICPRLWGTYCYGYSIRRFAYTGYIDSCSHQFRTDNGSVSILDAKLSIAIVCNLYRGGRCVCIKSHTCRVKSNRSGDTIDSDILCGGFQNSAFAVAHNDLRHISG